MKKYTILKLQVNNIELDEAVDAVNQLANNRESSYVCFANAHMTVLANQDLAVLKAVNNATLVFADGAPVAKAFQLIHGVKQDRIPGMDFFPKILETCNNKAHNITLLGSTPDVLDQIEERIKKEYPKIKIQNKISPPFDRPWNNQSYIDQINATESNMVFVALGCPLQEKWMYQNHNKIQAVMLGVGGAFPVYAKVIQRSPQWMANNGLEWLFRLIMEPKRMWKRYLTTNTCFVYLIIQRLLKLD